MNAAAPLYHAALIVTCVGVAVPRSPSLRRATATAAPPPHPPSRFLLLFLRLLLLRVRPTDRGRLCLALRPRRPPNDDDGSTAPRPPRVAPERRPTRGLGPWGRSLSLSLTSSSASDAAPRTAHQSSRRTARRHTHHIHHHFFCEYAAPLAAHQSSSVRPDATTFCISSHGAQYGWSGNCAVYFSHAASTSRRCRCGRGRGRGRGWGWRCGCGCTLRWGAVGRDIRRRPTQKGAHAVLAVASANLWGATPLPTPRDRALSGPRGGIRDRTKPTRERRRRRRRVRPKALASAAPKRPRELFRRNHLNEVASVDALLIRWHRSNQVRPMPS